MKRPSHGFASTRFYCREKPIMRPELSPRVIAHLRDAPADSAVARARAFGIDVAALAIRLATTTPLERLAELDRRLHDIELLRRGRP